MDPKDTSSGSDDDTLESLIDAAEKTRTAQSQKQKKLNIKDAEDTLNSLVEQAGGAARLTKQPRSRPQTQGALDAIFEEHVSEQIGDPGILVGLDDEGGVDGSLDGSMDDEATLAGAQSAGRKAKPVRKLDDGVDFWNELETMDQDFDPDD
jgi:hypothetical protein